MNEKYFKTVKETAALARLELSNAECHDYAASIEKIFGMLQEIHKLSDYIKTDALEPHYSGQPNNTMREDKAIRENVNDILQSCSNIEDNYFMVPKIVDEN